jgi:hypothetical protein
MTREDKRSYFCISVILAFLVVLTIQSFHNDESAMASDRLVPLGSFSSSYRSMPLDRRQTNRKTLIADSEVAGSTSASSTNISR